MTYPSSTAFRLLALTAGMAFGATAGAQEPPARFTSDVRVNNITVDVRVLDEQGVPVTGLARDDFRLFEDGSEQAVTNFLSVVGGQVGSAADPSLVGAAAPRKLLVFVDLYLMTEADKKPLLDSLHAAFDAGLPPGLTVAVVSYDGKIRVHTPPTASREKLLEAFAEVGRLEATGLQRQITLTSFVQRPMARESWGAFTSRRIQTEEYWFEMRRMVGRVETALSAALQQFSDSRSRKLALLVSPGFPPGNEVPIYRDYDFWLDRPIEYRNAGLFGHAAFVASELEYTLFTLDGSGTQLLRNDAATATSGTFTDVASVKFWREADRKDSLIQAARLTGGDSIFTRDASAAIADVERTTSTYYSLAYQPDHAGDGEQHAIRVEVVGHPEYQLFYRTTYVDRPFEIRDAERTRAALLTGEDANPLGVLLVLDKPSSKLRLGARHMRVHRIDAELRIPYSNLTMLPRGDRAWGQVQVVIVAVDEAGNQSDLAQQLVPIQIDANVLDEARQRGYFAYRFTLELEGGEQSVRVAVNDTLADTTSTAIADLDL